MSDDMRQFTVFRVGEEEFGVDIFKVIEILNPVKTYFIPGMPDFLSGVINLRGAVIPLLDLRKRFGTASRPEKERIVIVRVGKQKVGLCVDSVREITSFSENEIIPSPPIFREFKPEYLAGLGKKDERVIILLNTDMILTPEEKSLLSESRQIMEPSAHEGSEKSPEKR
jgi:purine-binding chemotaxis protein CheW